MSWHTSGWALLLRSLLRATGLTRFLGIVRPDAGYETRYEQQLTACVQPGDVVWDVGANIGHYTQIFSRIVGPEGRVYAFEPSPANFSRLAVGCSKLSNVTMLPFGLGAADGELEFQQGSDGLGATSRVMSRQPHGDVVRICAGDGVVARKDASVPRVMKIDVEGYEWEVLSGVSQLLRESSLRFVGLEVHFGLLEMRRLRHAPRLIEKTLESSGFHIQWVDSNHLVASRVP